MNHKLANIRRFSALTAALMLFTVNGFTTMAGSSSNNSSPVLYAEGMETETSTSASSDETGESTSPTTATTTASATTTTTSSNQGEDNEQADIIKQYSDRITKALDEMESHAREMITAANAGDGKKYNSESQAYDAAEKKLTQELSANSGVPSKDAVAIADNAGKRLEKIKKLRSQAETALANSLGGAQDENGNHYRLSSVKAVTSKVSKTSDEYSKAVAALGSNFRKGDLCAVYKVSLKVGDKPVRLIGGATKSVTIGYANDISGSSPVSYYIDYKNGSPAAIKRGSLNKWNLTVKASESVSYYVVCVTPRTGGGNTVQNGNTTVAPGNTDSEISADELSEILTAVRIDDSSEIAKKALKNVNTENKFTAVFQVDIPDDITLTPDTELIVNISCSETANKAVEIFRATEDDSVWLGSFIADSEGKLQFTSPEAGVFVLSWNEVDENEPEETSSDVETLPADEKKDSPVWPWVLATIAGTVAVITGAELLISRFFKKKN